MNNYLGNINNTNKEYTYGLEVLINRGTEFEINVAGMSGKAYKFERELSKGGLIFGYTADQALDFYHIISDPNNLKVISTLEQAGISNSTKVLRITAEHKDKILVDSEDDAEDCDARIETLGRPIVLAPADCLGICVTHTESGIYGTFHAGRMGIGMNIAEKFMKEFTRLVSERNGDLDSIEIYIPPHIRGYEYPHANNAFMFESNGKQTWWGEHPEFAPLAEDGQFYPDLGSSVVVQIRHILPNAKITASGLSTFDGTGGVSNSRDQLMLNNINTGKRNLRRNLVFVGMR